MHNRFILASSWLLACATATPQPLPVTSAVVAPVPGTAAVESHELFLYQEAHALAMEGRCDEARLVYRQYATEVRPLDTASADLALANTTTCQRRAEVDASLSEAATAILAGDDTRALALLDADRRQSAWREYYRGVALAGLHRTEEAARAFESAAAQPPGLSIAIYAKARAYHDAYQCAEAAAAYAEYADRVRPTHPEDAAMALDYASDCARVYVLPGPGEGRLRR
ncbi:MAG TPA: hypothetical protein VLM85_13425 [Polyangiaceae bacterium]|nr:hypothetical protein [Polyangiaceae bacterium]